MGRWSREELEEAFRLYQETALKAGTSGDWRAWADQSYRVIVTRRERSGLS